MIALKRAALAAAFVSFAVLLAGCLDNEPAQRRAFIEFLQTRIIDKPGLHVPILSDELKAKLGPYADQYRIMSGFNTDMDAGMSADFARAMQFGSPRSLDDLVKHRDMLPAITAGMAKMKDNLDKALADADAAHAALKQPEDLKVVYDRAYERMVTRPANVFRELIPMILASLPAIEKIAAFLDEHRDKIEYRMGAPYVRDAGLRPQLETLMQEAARAAKTSEEGKRKLRALMESK